MRIVCKYLCILSLVTLCFSCATIKSSSNIENYYLRTERTPLEIKYENSIDYNFIGEHFSDGKLVINATTKRICSNKVTKFYQKYKIIKNEIDDPLYKTLLGVDWSAGLLGTVGGIYLLNLSPQLSTAKSSPDEFSDRDEAITLGVLSLIPGISLLITAIVDSVRAVDTVKDIGINSEKADDEEIECGTSPLKNEPVKIALNGMSLKKIVSEEYQEKEITNTMETGITMGYTDGNGMIEIQLSSLGEKAYTTNAPWATITIAKTTKEINLPDILFANLKIEYEEKRYQDVVSINKVESYKEFLEEFSESKYLVEIMLKIIDVLINEGKAEEKNKNYDVAILKYETALGYSQDERKNEEIKKSINGTHLKEYMEIANTAKEKKDYEKATENYKKAIKYIQDDIERNKINKIITSLYVKLAEEQQTASDYINAIRLYVNALIYSDEKETKMINAKIAKLRGKLEKLEKIQENEYENAYRVQYGSTIFSSQRALHKALTTYRLEYEKSYAIYTGLSKNGKHLCQLDVNGNCEVDTWVEIITSIYLTDQQDSDFYDLRGKNACFEFQYILIPTSNFFSVASSKVEIIDFGDGECKY